jgi:hypothetical protein
VARILASHRTSVSSNSRATASAVFAASATMSGVVARGRSGDVAESSIFG